MARQPEHAAELAQVRDKALALSFRCAVLAEDLDTAHRRGVSAGWGSPLDPDAVWAHAVALYNAGRLADTVTVLADSGAADVGGTTGTEARDLSISALVGLSRWDEAKAECLQENASLAARQGTASALAGAGRASDAADVLALVCPELPPKDRAACESERSAGP